MRIGQIVFLLAGLAFAVYATRLRSTVTDRLVYLLLAGAGCVLVLYPDWSTGIAHRVGIGRGVDLVIYLFIVFSLFHYASGAAKARQTERAITGIVRRLALMEVRPDSALRGESAPSNRDAASAALPLLDVPPASPDRQ
jgi:hypothetical protein